MAADHRLVGHHADRRVHIPLGDPHLGSGRQAGQSFQHGLPFVGRCEQRFAAGGRCGDHTPLRAFCLPPFSADGHRPHHRKRVVLYRPRAAAPRQPDPVAHGRNHRIVHRAALPGIDRHTLRTREIARVEPEKVQPRFAHAVTLGRRGVPGLGRHRHGAGPASQQRQFVARPLRNQARERHRGSQTGCSWGLARQEHARRGDRRGRLPVRLHGLDDDRDGPPFGGVKPGPARCGREMQPSPEVRRRIERGFNDGRKTFCPQQRTAVAGRSALAGAVCAAGRDGRADSVCGPGCRIDDADVDVSGRLLTDGIAEFPAERGVLLRNSCKLHNGIF